MRNTENTRVNFQLPVCLPAYLLLSNTARQKLALELRYLTQNWIWLALSQTSTAFSMVAVSSGPPFRWNGMADGNMTVGVADMFPRTYTNECHVCAELVRRDELVGENNTNTPRKQTTVIYSECDDIRARTLYVRKGMGLE